MSKVWYDSLERGDLGFYGRPSHVTNRLASENFPPDVTTARMFSQDTERASTPHACYDIY